MIELCQRNMVSLFPVIDIFYNVYLPCQGTALETGGRMLRIMGKFSVNALKSSSLCNKVSSPPVLILSL